MKQYSASHVTSRNSSLPHNRRDKDFTGNNVDPNGIHEEWYRIEIEDLYEQLFSEAIEKYNAKQKRNDRKLNGGSREYLEKIRNEWTEYYKKGIVKNGKLVRHFNDYDDALRYLDFNRGRNPKSAYYESIVQVGNHENQPDEQTCRAILKEYVDTFQERNPNLRLMEVHYHADEKTPHIHLDFVPVATGYKQGLEVQNGFDRALMQQLGIERSGTKFETPALAWYEQERKVLSDIALQHGIEISSEKVLEPGRTDHETVRAYKARMLNKQGLETEASRLRFREALLDEARDELLEAQKVNDKHERDLYDREKLVEARESNLNELIDNLLSDERQKLSEAEYELQRRFKKKKEELDEREQELITKENKYESLSPNYLYMQSHYEILKKRSDEIYNAMFDELDNYTIDWMKRTKIKGSDETIFERYKSFAKLDLEKSMKPKQRTSESQIFDAVGRYSSSNYASKPVSKDRDLER